MSTGETNDSGYPANGLNSIQEGVKIPLVTSISRNRDKLWPDGQLGLHELRVNLHLFLFSS